ncbi:MAG: putative Flp pilus-assembly TadE/G-like/putative Tad-like Flp pilus-assembly [Chloroflexi bacterium]|nr:putative Flp pilus-assembly TadE/G-like/putative Tad-like Flp pilus-assembly [Chloroflexota bacterium]
MKFKQEDAAKGQIVVIFALMLVVLLAMAGLAIDVAHARSVAEDAQRAADAGALAGVAYLPGDVSTAQTRAGALSASNGFSATNSNGPCLSTPGTVCISYAPDALNRVLGETITVRVQTSFLHLLGVSAITVVRSAKASYDDPIALGAPDHMLGFAPYPTKAIQSTQKFGQGFYLEVRGPYSGLEHGDAFSPYFTTIRGDNLLSSSNAAGTTGFAAVSGKLNEGDCTTTANIPYDPSKPTTACGSNGTTAPYVVNNPWYNGQNANNPGRHGYTYVFSLPPNMSKPVLIKILNPYDECNLRSKDSTYLNSTVYGPDGKGLTQADSTEAIDQCSPPGPFYFNNAAGATTLKFTLYQPSARVSDPFAPLAPDTVTGTATDSTGANAWTVTTSTTYANNKSQKGAADPAMLFGTDPATSSASGRGFQWFTLAQAQNTSGQTEYLRLSVESVQNVADKSFGQGGKNFALAVCKTDSSTTSIGDPTQSAEWMAAATAGSTADPMGTATSYDTSCADPNVVSSGDGYGCSDGTVTCYHVNASDAFCIETLQVTAGPAFIPIAQLDNHLAGSSITIRLFDAGDIGSSGGTNAINILGPMDDPATYVQNGTNGGQPIHLDISAPAHSGYGPQGQGRGQMPWFVAGNCLDYNAYDYPDNSHAPCPPMYKPGIVAPIYPATNADGNIFGNDTWLNIHVNIPTSYNPSPTNAWWKVFYNLTGGATNVDDTTTWEVVSGAAPVHLLTGQ